MEKTSILTIRVYEKEKNLLHTESETKNMTINSLGRQIISKHIEWYRHTKDIEYTYIPKSLLKSLFENVDDAIINDITVNTCDTLKNTILFICGEITIQNIVTVLDSWLNMSNFCFRHFTDFHIDKYVISHDIGKGFSEYFMMSINSVLDVVGYTANNIIIDKTGVSFAIIASEKMNNSSLN